MLKLNLTLTPILVSLTLFTSIGGISPKASAFSLFDGEYDEAVDGELSNDGSSPTDLGSVSIGTNRITATFNAASPDYFTFFIPKNVGISEVVMNLWSPPVTDVDNFEDIAFAAIEKGNTFDYVYNSSAPTAEGLLGWSHLRSTQVGTSKVLTEMSLSNLDHDVSGVADFYNEEADSNPYAGHPNADELTDNLRDLANQWVSGAEGFDVPLSEGDYSFWFRQGSEQVITVQLDFNAVHVPESFSILSTLSGVAMGLLLLKRSQQS